MMRKFIITALALISILAFGLAGCNSTPQTKRRGIEITNAPSSTIYYNENKDYYRFNTDAEQGEELEWSVSDQAKAEISDDGKLTFKADGTVSVTVKNVTTGKKDSVSVTATYASVEITNKPTVRQYDVGATDFPTLEYAVTPSDGLAFVAKWVSTDENVATVENGEITITGTGITFIKVQMEGCDHVYDGFEFAVIDATADDPLNETFTSAIVDESSGEFVGKFDITAQPTVQKSIQKKLGTANRRLHLVKTNTDAGWQDIKVTTDKLVSGKKYVLSFDWELSSGAETHTMQINHRNASGLSRIGLANGDLNKSGGTWEYEFVAKSNEYNFSITTGLTLAFILELDNVKFTEVYVDPRINEQLIGASAYSAPAIVELTATYTDDVNKLVDNATIGLDVNMNHSSSGRQDFKFSTNETVTQGKSYSLDFTVKVNNWGTTASGGAFNDWYVIFTHNQDNYAGTYALHENYYRKDGNVFYVSIAINATKTGDFEFGIAVSPSTYQSFNYTLSNMSLTDVTELIGARAYGVPKVEGLSATYTNDADKLVDGATVGINVNMSHSSQNREDFKFNTNKTVTQDKTYTLEFKVKVNNWGTTSSGGAFNDWFVIFTHNQDNYAGTYALHENQYFNDGNVYYGKITFTASTTGAFRFGIAVSPNTYQDFNYTLCNISLVEVTA